MSSSQDEIRAALDAVEAAHGRLRVTCSDAVGNAFRVEVCERLEAQRRVNRGLMYRLVGELVEPPDGPADPDLPAGTVMSKLLWQRLRITPGEVRRRMGVAARIGPRRSLTGAVLAPELPHLACAVENGEVGEEHIGAVCHALDVLPSAVAGDKREKAERILVRHAVCQDATFVTVIGRRIADHLNPDGLFDEHDRARRRGLHLAPQGPDGMSRLSGWLDPETRAYLEAVNAAVRPGRHQPDGDVPDEADPDTRSGPQRLHDAVKLGLKAGIASGEFGPASRAAGHRHRHHDTARAGSRGSCGDQPHRRDAPPARTGGGSALPMRDLIRMAADALHYLAVFEDHSNRPLYLARTKRVATADQRIICYARDRGCTRPNCLEAGYHCEVHHEPDWRTGGRTDAHCLYFGCGPDHTLVSKNTLKTKVTDTGRLAWTDGTGPPEINRAHHPDELLAELFDDDEK